jgi:XTP/dITP diphosphohydrolase
MGEVPRLTGEAVVATSNPGKLREIQAILSDLPAVLRPLGDFAPVTFPEEGDDYEENAAVKARTVASALGLPALADDSGLEVVGLEGRPGPRSARYGGPGLDDTGRVRVLLAEMAPLTGDQRAARFVCVAALAIPDGRVWTAHGEVAGRILAAPRGDGGFGYDPVFQLTDGADGQVMAEIEASKKNRISHRARAFRQLLML